MWLFSVDNPLRVATEALNIHLVSCILNHCGKIICCNQQTDDFWIKYIELASTIVGKTKLKAWTSKEYECINAIYSCLIPKNSVIGIDVEDIIKACLNLYGIKNSQGVVRCHTSHTMRDYQRICILEVTEQLAGIFEHHGQVLSGPFGQLTFCLRSGDNSEETTEGEIVVEQIATPVQPSILQLPRERVQSDTVSISGSVPETDIDQLLSTSPAKTILSPARSETDSVNLVLVA